MVIRSNTLNHPWRVSQNRRSITVNDNQGHIICRLQVPGEFTAAVQQYNAALIQQAPELLDFREQAIAGLRTLRQEWEDALDGLPLAESNPGMILADVVEAIGLSTDEQLEVLGYTPNLSAAVQPPVILQKPKCRQMEFPQMAPQLVYA